jgi:cellulose synthase/poly-beta-1,6-N-acetylglucosamine synthase-like glycosyltransferase
MNISQLATLCTDIFLLSSTFFILIICLFFLIECSAALFLKASSTNLKNWQNTRVAVLIPAHNEELVIASTLEKLTSVLKQQDSLVVVADNCSDSTAKIARAMGVIAIERNDSIRKGKGYALDYGLQFLEKNRLEKNPPDVVIFVDADCTVHKGAIEQLTECAITTKRPIQATYLMLRSKNSQSAKDSLSQFSIIVRNQVRPLGTERLGINCPLLGTGMAFPWSMIRSVDLANGHLLEDAKLGLDLAIAGHKPMLCPQAKVTSDLPSSSVAATSQKTRWVHGHFQMIQTYVPILFKEAIHQKRFDLLTSILDLCVPPLSLLVIAWLLVMASSIISGILGASWIPAITATIAGFCLLTGLVITWINFARQELPLDKLLTIPLYILWKIPVYVQFLVKPQTIWLRTQREVENPTLSKRTGL